MVRIFWSKNKDIVSGIEFPVLNYVTGGHNNQFYFLMVSNVYLLTVWTCHIFTFSDVCCVRRHFCVPCFIE